MASQYGYATVASLELFASEDYGLIDATFLTDAHVEAKITAAEQIINTYLGQTFTGTIPDEVPEEQKLAVCYARHWAETVRQHTGS